MGALWAARAEQADPLRSAWRLAALAQFLIGICVLIAALLLLPVRYGEGPSMSLIAGAVLASVTGVAAAVFLVRVRPIEATAAALVSAAILYGTLTVLAAPRLDRLWVSSQVAELVAHSTQAGDAPPALAGFEEPSLVFQLGTATRLTNGRGAADTIAARHGLAVVEDRERSAFLARLSQLHQRAVEIGGVSGLNYSRGRSVHVVVFRLQ
jgi:hypothetical protein